MPDANGNPIEGEEGYVTPPTDDTVVDDTVVDDTVVEGASDDDSGALGGPDDVTPAVPEYEATTLDKGEQTGTDTEGNPIYENQDPTDIRSGSDFVSPESTVAGQLEKIFNKESPLQKLAATRAKEQASALGMSSSSAAIGAGQRALYDSAMPIAQQDAATYAEAQAKEQTAVYAKAQINKEAAVAGDLTVQKAKIAERQQTLNDEFTKNLQDMAAEDQQDLLVAKAAFDKTTATALADANETITKLSLDAEIEGKIINQTHDMLNNVQISWQQMVTNDNFLNNFEKRADMLVALNNLLAPVESAIKMSAQQAGVYDDEFAGWITDMMSEAAYV